MNYRNFQRHEYFLNWNGFKRAKEDTNYLAITVRITRDHYWPFGEVVTDTFESKYACKLCGFNYNDLDDCGDGLYRIKEGSGEWNNYLNNPGIDPNEYLKNCISEHVGQYITNLLKDQGINVPITVVPVRVD